MRRLILSAWSLLVGLLLTWECPAEEREWPMPVERILEGWTVEVDPGLLTEEHTELGERALSALANHLQRVAFILPEERLEELRKVRIRLERNGSLKSIQYHPSRGWLIANGHDPSLAERVHVPHAKELLNRRTWAKHPYVILHELAHAWHDQVLGFDEPRIKAAYENARDSEIYEEVLLFDGRTVRHYGMTNHKEYFAEATEAYFGVNDFYPFVRAELGEHDPRMYDLLVELWGPVAKPRKAKPEEQTDPR